MVISAPQAPQRMASLPHSARPDLGWCSRPARRGTFAGKVDVTALHLDRKHVSGSVIVPATGLRIKVDATNFWRSGNHGRTDKRNKSNQSSVIFRRSRRSHGRDLRNESRISNVARPEHLGLASGSWFRVDIETDLVARDFLVWEDTPIRCPATDLAVFPSGLLRQMCANPSVRPR